MCGTISCVLLPVGSRVTSEYLVDLLCRLVGDDDCSKIVAPQLSSHIPPALPLPNDIRASLHTRADYQCYANQFRIPNSNDLIDWPAFVLAITFAGVAAPNVAALTQLKRAWLAADTSKSGYV